MLKITVELIRGGIGKPRTLATGTITDDGTIKTPARGNYDVVLYGASGRVWGKSRVEDWPRKRRHVWELVYAALDRATMHRTMAWLDGGKVRK